MNPRKQKPLPESETPASQPAPVIKPATPAITPVVVSQSVKITEVETEEDAEALCSQQEDARLDQLVDEGMGSLPSSIQDMDDEDDPPEIRAVAHSPVLPQRVPRPPPRR